MRRHVHQQQQQHLINHDINRIRYQVLLVLIAIPSSHLQQPFRLIAAFSLIIPSKNKKRGDFPFVWRALSSSSVTSTSSLSSSLPFHSLVTTADLSTLTSSSSLSCSSSREIAADATEKYPQIWIHNRCDAQKEQMHNASYVDDESDVNITEWKQLGEYEKYDGPGNLSSSPTTNSIVATTLTAVQQTWNWCQHFVRPLDLCPWAPLSLDTVGAIQFFVVMVQEGTTMNYETYVQIIDSVSNRFTDQVIARSDKHDDDKNDPPTVFERAAIYFVLFANPSGYSDDGTKLSAYKSSKSNPLDDFNSFYEWFVDLEDGYPFVSSTMPEYLSSSIYDRYPDVIVAPFHPNWQFSDDCRDHEHPSIASTTTTTTTSDDASYEKRTPYPTISLVSARVVEQAGESVTNKIGIHNEEQLSNHPDIATYWNSAIFKNE